MTRSVVASGPESLVHSDRRQATPPPGAHHGAVPCSDALDVVCLAVVIALVGATLLFVF